MLAFRARRGLLVSGVVLLVEIFPLQHTLNKVSDGLCYSVSQDGHKLPPVAAYYGPSACIGAKK